MTTQRSANMTLPLQSALRSDLALQELEQSLLSHARLLYRKGFAGIGAAQMATVGDLILYAVTHEQANEAIKDFLTKQLEKLDAKIARGEARSSWALLAHGGHQEETLGGAFRLWIVEERYLDAPAALTIDHLLVLQRFWAYFYGSYRYAAKIGQEMPLDNPNP
jgi:hypothetical protein